MGTAKFTDTEMLNWLQTQFGVGLIHDDNGHWAVSTSGMQNVPEGPEPEFISSSFWVEPYEWKNSVREAIESAMKEEANNETC